MKEKCGPDNVNSKLLVFTHIDIMQCKVIFQTRFWFEKWWLK